MTAAAMMTAAAVGDSTFAPSRGHLGPYWINIGPSWRRPGAVLGNLDCIFAALEASWDLLGGRVKPSIRLGSNVEPSNVS